MAKYSTTNRGVAVEGEVFLPSRCIEEATECSLCIMIYKGEKESVTSGRKYYDLAFLNSERAETLLRGDIDVEVVDSDDERDSTEDVDPMEMSQRVR